MDIQNFFYTVASISIVLVGILSFILLVIIILAAIQLFKFSKNLKRASQKSEEILEKIKNKANTLVFFSLLKQLLYNLFSAKKEKRGKKE
jgi:biopolymer transport protein ExbB/TolQ